VSVGIRNPADPALAFTPFFTTPEFPEPLAIATTDEAAIYTRPSAAELVSSHGSWTVGGAPLDDLVSGIPAVTTGDAAANAPLAPQPDAAPATIHDYAFIDDGVDIDLTAAARSLIVIAQDDAYGWEATVDGRRTDIHTVYGSLTAVFVEAGDERVELRYRPRTFAVGWKISALALLVILALAISDMRRSVDRRELGDELAERLPEVPQQRPEARSNDRLIREH